MNSLNWFTDAINCPMDVVKYVIYFQPPGASKLVLLDSTDQLFYSHNNLVTMAGCYGLVAVDYNGNRSAMSDTICVPADICGKYHLPNIFSPNNDERNDLFIPFPYSGVEKIDIQIYNRWGNLLFATTDPDIKWDGKIQGSQTDVPDGVYYYICDVFEISFNGVTKRTLKGSILLVR
jgi:gliding motility-associated-like protein